MYYITRNSISRQPIIETFCTDYVDKMATSLYKKLYTETKKIMGVCNIDSYTMGSIIRDMNIEDDLKALRVKAEHAKFPFQYVPVFDKMMTNAFRRVTEAIPLDYLNIDPEKVRKSQCMLQITTLLMELITADGVPQYIYHSDESIRDDIYTLRVLYAIVLVVYGEIGHASKAPTKRTRMRTKSTSSSSEGMRSSSGNKAVTPPPSKTRKRVAKSKPADFDMDLSRMQL